jgi:hypothetical protein
MSHKVFVTNIPVRACVNGWVEVPDGTTPDGLGDAIAEALKEKGYAQEKEIHDGLEVDVSVVDKWEFTTPLEST